MKSIMPPAVCALLIQLFSFILSLLVFVFADLVFFYQQPIFCYVFFQAAIAAFFSFLLDLDWWWYPIQFSFPVLVSLFSISQIPSLYYLVAFIFLALVYWTTFRSQVPYFPSKSSLIPILLDLLPPEKSIKFIDVGSGFGGLLIELSQAKEHSSFFGIEIAPIPWSVSLLRAKIYKSKVQFTLGSYENIDFGEYDVVFAYLSPAAMPDLWKKAKSEMNPGSILLSYEFIIPNIEPDLCVNLNLNDPILYLWRI